jgi:hypothetical protein
VSTRSLSEIKNGKGYPWWYWWDGRIRGKGRVEGRQIGMSGCEEEEGKLARRESGCIAIREALRLSLYFERKEKGKAQC